MCTYIILKVTKKCWPIKTYILFKEATRQSSLCNFTKKWLQKQSPGGVLIKRCYENISKFTEEHSCRSVISIKLLSSFVEIALQHECSPVNLLHVFRTPFYKSTSGWLFLWLLRLFAISITSTAFSKHSGQLFPRNLFLELHQGQLNWKQRVSGSKLYMLWIWPYPVSKKELFLKLALPNKQIKLLKTIRSELGFYCNCKL